MNFVQFSHTDEEDSRLVLACVVPKTNHNEKFSL